MEAVVQGDLTFQLLEGITDGFSQDRKLGSGSYGKVYMGLQKDGTKIAVKLLYDNPGLDEEQFQNEFNHLKRLQHQNIVRLIGCCYESQEQIVEYKGKFVLAEKRYRALCLEYMHNGSLDKYLSDEYNEHDWPTCYTIIMGICKGLKYLHEELKPPTYHLDLKPANVLLDENMIPKIADFGLSRFFEEDQTRITTSSLGTIGYSPPEYINMGLISVKFDIFSLGVIIIKIMAGRMGYYKIADMSSEQFVELVHGNWTNRTDGPSVFAMESYSKQVKTCIEIALRCVQADRHKRPCIGDIINMLNEAGTRIYGLSQSLDVLTPDSWSSMQQVSLSVVTGALEPTLEKLFAMLGDKYKLFKGVHGEIRFLINELAAMHAFILKLSEQEDPDLQDKAWMKKVRELSYDIDDSINVFMQHVDNKAIKPYGFIEKIRNSIWKVGLQKEIIEVKERFARYKIDESRTINATVDPRALAIFEDASNLVGIDKPKAELIKILTEKDGCVPMQRLKVVSIVGSGGMGKTTLAFQLYQELKVHFQCSAFVSVSRNPDMMKILWSILHTVSGQLYANTECGSIHQLISKIADFLENKRYFIVLDDIWDVNTWDVIKHAISQTSCGGRIITTTRSMIVAESSGHVYHIKPLSMMDAKRLFYRRLFISEEEFPLHLEEVSDKILKKCDGLPLAIIAISGLLANKTRTKDQWDQVLKSIGSTLERNHSIVQMMNILSLSYFDLPRHLKTCLLYLSVFPKGYVIEKQDLIMRWIAEGFIHKESGYTEHELGDKYFNELINRGLIHPEKTDKYDKVKSCRVHDMVLDYIVSKSIEENFVTLVGIHGLGIAPESKVRRLSLQVDNQGNINLPMSVVLSHTRSLNVFGYSEKIPCLDEFLHLRVLNFRGCNQLLNHHLANIRRLFQLRYLNLRDTGVNELPEEIGNLECLEMLELRGTDVSELPAAIVNLRRLVHLLTDTGVKFPDGIAKMQALEVLKHVSAFKQSFNFLQELHQLKNLRKLHLSFDGFPTGDTTGVKQWMEAIASSLDKLCTHGIFRLTIVEGGSFLQEVWAPTSSSLQKLMTWNSAIPWVPNWAGSLVSLQQLRLEVEGVRQKDLFILGGLPSLLILDLIVMAKSEDRLTVNGGVGFPCLRKFCYYMLDEGMDLTFVSGSMPKLDKLIIHFYAAKTESLTSFSFDFGIGNLPCLTSVKLGVFGSVESVDNVVKAMERAASAHPNHPSLCFE